MDTMANKLDMAETEWQREDAAFQMMMDALAEDKRERRKTKRICIICATVSVVAFLLAGALMVFLAAGITVTTDESTHEEYSQSVEGDSAVINNGQFEQYNDNAKNGGNE